MEDVLTNPVSSGARISWAEARSVHKLRAATNNQTLGPRGAVVVNGILAKPVQDQVYRLGRLCRSADARQRAYIVFYRLRTAIELAPSSAYGLQNQGFLGNTGRGRKPLAG
jgi:hypothetical protein